MALPGIMEQSDTLSAKLDNGVRDGIEAEVSQLSYLCRDFESQLLSWYEQLQALEGGDTSLYWEEPSELYASLPMDSEARVFPLMLSFLNIDVAQQLVLHWVGLLVMNSLLEQMHDKLQMAGISTSALFATDSGGEDSKFVHHQMAVNITRSLEYLSFPQMGLSIVNYLGLPLNMTYGYWNTRQAKERFFYAIILARLRTMNTGAGSFIDSMARSGGGGAAFRKLLIDKTPPSTPNIVAY